MQLLQKVKAPLPFFHKNWATRLVFAFTALLLCLTVVSQFEGAKTAYAASIGTRSASVRPLTSGGGCNTSTDGRVSACISVNSSHQIVADAYMNNNYVAEVQEYIYDATTGQSTTLYWLGYGSGHFGCVIIPDAGHLYWATVKETTICCSEQLSSPMQWG